MAKRESGPVGSPCWVDLMTSDTDRSRAFYCELFGWEAEEPDAEHGGYFNYTKNGVRVAGCMAAEPGAGMPEVWSVYLTTDDARKTVEATAANGGEVQVEPMDVGDLGTMAIVADPGGAVVGIWQPGTHPGFGFHGEAGAPSWFELNTRDYEASVVFYRDVFRWETIVVSDSDEFRYTTLVDGDDWLAGIGDATRELPDGVPNHWAVYFGTDDTDASVAKVVELGGKVIDPPEDTEYGRLAKVADPNGAVFQFVAPNEAMPAKP